MGAHRVIIVSVAEGSMGHFYRGQCQRTAGVDEMFFDARLLVAQSRLCRFGLGLDFRDRHLFGHTAGVRKLDIVGGRGFADLSPCVSGRH